MVRAVQPAGPGDGLAREVERLFSHTAITSVGNVANGVLGFLLLPLYSRYLPPDAFGKVELISASVILAGTFFMLGLPSALARRFNYEHSDAPDLRRAAASTAIGTIVLSTGAVASVCVALADDVSRLLFGTEALRHLVWAGAWTLVVSALVSACTTVLRGLYRTVTLAAILLAGALLNAGTAAFLILARGLTFEAPVFALAVSQTTLATLMLLACRDQLRWRASAAELRAMLAFGLPLILAGLSFYVLSTADRYLLRYFLDEAAVGLYGMGVRVASVLSVAVFVPFQMVWNVALYDIARRPDAQAVFARFTTQFLAAGLLMVAGLALFAELPFRWLLDERYWPAERVVGLLGFSLLLFALSEVLKVGLLVRDQTKWLPVRVVVAGLCNLALDWWWIPRYGILGAALATSVSFLVLNGVTLLMTRNLYPIRFEWRRIAVLAGLVAATAGAYVASPSEDLLARVVWRAAAWSALLALLLGSGILDWRTAQALAREAIDRRRMQRGG